MSDQESGIIKIDKIQETSTIKLLICITRFEEIFSDLKVMKDINIFKTVQLKI